MAITRIRGGQLHDRTIDGLKIQQGALLNEHIASNAAIAESKLDINWAAHTETLQNKKIVDYVQVNNTDVGGLSEIDVTAISILPGTDNGVFSDPLSGEGVIIDSPKNRIPLRDAITGDPILDDHGCEVFGRIIKLLADPNAVPATDDRFVVHFYTDETGVETSFTMPAVQTIDWQYARRFNLLTINEMFAANEKFVEAAADITAHLNLEQLAKDLYGSIFNLDRDGNANLPISIAQQISDEVLRATIAENNLQTNIDGEAAARIAADNSIIEDLSSTATGKGASLIGFEDADDKFVATTVEGALVELQNRIGAVAGGGSAAGTELHDARASSVKSPDGIVQKIFNSLDDRLEEIESDAKLDKETLESYKTSNDIKVNELDSAKGSDLTLTDRLDRMEQVDTDEKTAREAADAALQIEVDTIEIDLESYKTSNDVAVDNLTTDLAAEVTRATGVESDLDVRLTEVENEVSGTYERTVATTNNYFPIATFTSLDERFSDIESKTDEGLKQASSSNTEIVAARGTHTTLDERLDVALNDDGTLKAGKQIHDHKKTIMQISVAAKIIDMPVGETFIADGTLDVYINGILQANGVNFTDIVDIDGKGIGIDFGTDEVLAGDVVVLEWIKYNDQ